MQRPELNGSYDCVLDERFRFAVPAKQREPFKDGIVLSIWFDGAAVMTPRDHWPTLVRDHFGEMNILDDDQRRLNRLIRMHTFDHDSLDKQGRVVLPEKLRAATGITSKVRTIGYGDYVELWNPDLLDDDVAEAKREGVSTLGKRIDQRAREASHSA